MSLTREDVQKIAHLARLGLEPDALDRYAGELSRILELVEQMQSVDTSDIQPMAHPLDAIQRLRADEVTESNQRDKAQSIAPSVQDGLYLVPRVVD